MSLEFEFELVCLGCFFHHWKGLGVVSNQRHRRRRGLGSFCFATKRPASSCPAHRAWESSNDQGLGGPECGPPARSQSWLVVGSTAGCTCATAATISEVAGPPRRASAITTVKATVVVAVISVPDRLVIRG